MADPARLPLAEFGDQMLPGSFEELCRRGRWRDAPCGAAGPPARPAADGEAALVEVLRLARELPVTPPDAAPAAAVRFAHRAPARRPPSWLGHVQGCASLHHHHLLRRFHCSTSYSLLTGPQSTIRLHQRVRPGAGRLAGGCGLVLAAAGLKAGQEDYWIRQIAESRCEYLSGHGESPGQWYGARAAALGLAGIAQDQQCRAMFEGKDPITGEQVAQPRWVADPRSKLPAGPLAERLRALADARSIPVEALAGSQALAGEVRAVMGRREVKAETVERVARHILKTDPQDIYGDAYREAARHAGRRVDDRDACFDLCFSDVKSGSLFYAGADEATRREYNAARQEAIRGALGWLEQHAVGVRRGHGGAERLDGRGLLAIGYDHRTSREGDPQLHTHLLVQNLTEGPDGRVTALDSKRGCGDRKSTRLNSSHPSISYAVFCLKK